MQVGSRMPFVLHRLAMSTLVCPVQPPICPRSSRLEDGEPVQRRCGKVQTRRTLANQAHPQRDAEEELPGTRIPL